MRLLIGFLAAGLCAQTVVINPPGGGGGGGAVSSVYGRTGAVTATTSDYTAAQVTNAVDSTGSYSNPGWITALAAAKVTGLAAVATSASASDITAGTLAAARMPNAGVTTGDVSGTFPATLVKQLHETRTAVNFAASPYTVLAADSYIYCDASAGAVVINLPATSGSGRELSVKKIDATANACTLTRAGSDVIDGATTAALSTQYVAAKVADRATGFWDRTHVNQLVGDVTGASTANVVGALPESRITNLTSDLAAKAPLASPTFTGTLDASGAAHTLPAKVDTFANIPATCTVGEQFFASNATAGVNKYYCTSTNVWTQGGVNAANLTTGTLPFARVSAGLTGSCPANTTCVVGSTGVITAITAFPNANLRGTFLGVGLSNSASAGTSVYPFADSFSLTSACAGATANYWQMPVAGYVRNVTANISGANTNSLIRFNVEPDCAANSGGGIPNGGVSIPSLAAAGGYIGGNAADYWHLNQYAGLGFQFLRHGAAVPAIISSIGAEFISDDGTADSVFGMVQNISVPATTTWLGIDSFSSSTEANIEIPIPIGGTLKNMMFYTSVGPTSSTAVFVNKNGANTAITATIGAADAGGTYADVTHTASVVAGDYIDFQVNATTGPPTFQAISLGFVPTDGTSAILHGSLNAGTVAATATYAKPFSPLTSTTEANSEYTSPIACSASHLYVYQITANGAVTTTFTLYKNNAATAVTGTLTGAGTGSQAIDTTHSVAIAAGDRISLQYVAAGGTSGTMSGWSAQCN